MSGLKKLLVILVLLFSVGCCSYYCYGEQSQTLDFTPPKSIFDELNNDLTTLEQNWNLLKTENQNLQLQLETLETLQKEQIKYSTNLEIQSKAYEKKYRFWRNTSVVLTCILVPTVITTTITLIVKNNIRP